MINTTTLLRSVRYFGVGGLAALVYWVVMLVLSARLGVDPLVASVIGYAAGFVTAYVGHRNFTYRSNATISPELARFLIIQGTCFCVGNIVFWLTVKKIGWNVAVGGGLLTLVNFVVSFAAYELWVFRQMGRREK
jgi:putative flippase GtrA